MKDSKWNSRKLSVAIGVEVLTTFLLWADKVPASVWETVTMATVVSFCASQAAVDRSKYQAWRPVSTEYEDGIRRE